MNFDFNSPLIDYEGRPTDAFFAQLMVKVEGVPGLVWDEPLKSHTITGSYGEEIATTSDIQSSVATSVVTYNSGSIIVGTDTFGTIGNTIIRNNVYWSIAESVDGLTVEFDFRLPSPENRPGAFTIFGKYDGKGSNHYMELWAWNVEALDWEILHEKFMESSTIDQEYSRAYAKQHIDRLNNNLVKIKLVHNVSTYHTSHILDIDYCELSSINVITAADIATAVRVELTPELAHTMTLENNPGMTPTQATMLLELYALMGLDATKPLVVNNAQRTAGAGIVQNIQSNDIQTIITRV